LPYTLSFRAHDIYKNNVQCEIQKRIEIIQGASHIITISSYNKNTLKTNLSINKDIDIIHGCINTDFFKPIKESKSHRSIITICRLDEQKGLIYLLEACHILNRRNIEYECTIIGEGPEKKRYEKCIDELKIPNINFLDFIIQDDICKHLNRSAVFVLPCVVSSDGRRDILANVLKEAMAMELPVITSNISGIEELVDDGINGILVPPKNPEAIAEAIIKLFSNCDLRIKMGEEARKKIKRDFNVKNEVRKLENVFSKVVVKHAK
jgi:glycosyltransferase involved in cell wall biosynthesis